MTMRTRQETHGSRAVNFYTQTSIDIKLYRRDTVVRISTQRCHLCSRLLLLSTISQQTASSSVQLSIATQFSLPILPNGAALVRKCCGGQCVHNSCKTKDDGVTWFLLLMLLLIVRKQPLPPLSVRAAKVLPSDLPPSSSVSKDYDKY